MLNLRTPLYDRHVALKGRMVAFGGWDMPVQYAGIVAEHFAVRTAAGAFDVSHMARIAVTGPGGLGLLEHVFTNRVGTMADGQVRYGLLCNESGGVLDDVLVYRWPDGWSVIANASSRGKVVAWLNRHAAGRDVTVADTTDATALIAVQGPKAAEYLAELFADDITALKYYHAAPNTYHDTACVVSRTGYTGEDGFEIGLAADVGLILWDELVSKGVAPCGLGARDTLRLEAAMPLYGHELTETADPIHAGLGWAVKLDKSEFVGRDALQAAAADATKPVRVGLVLEGKRAAREGSVIRTPDGRTVGAVTSGSYGPTLEQSIAMGFVEPASAAVGTTLDVDIRGTGTPATVVKLPFYKRAK